MAPIITMMKIDTELGTATIMSEKCLEERANPIAADCMPVLFQGAGIKKEGGVGWGS